MNYFAVTHLASCGFVTLFALAVKIYQKKLTELQDYLQRKMAVISGNEAQEKKLNIMRAVIYRDGNSIVRCTEILTKVKQAYKDKDHTVWKEKVKNSLNRAFYATLDALTDNQRTELSNCKFQIDESIRNLSFYMLFESFEKGNSEKPVTKHLSSLQGRDFWIQRIGADKASVNIDDFTKQFKSHLVESLGWDEKRADDILPTYRLKSIVHQTIGTFFKEHIPKTEFD